MIAGLDEPGVGEFEDPVNVEDVGRVDIVVRPPFTFQVGHRIKNALSEPQNFLFWEEQRRVVA